MFFSNLLPQLIGITLYARFRFTIVNSCVQPTVLLSQLFAFLSSLCLVYSSTMTNMIQPSLPPASCKQNNYYCHLEEVTTFLTEWPIKLYKSAFAPSNGTLLAPSKENSLVWSSLQNVSSPVAWARSGATRWVVAGKRTPARFSVDLISPREYAKLASHVSADGGLVD